MENFQQQVCQPLEDNVTPLSLTQAVEASRRLGNNAEETYRFLQEYFTPLNCEIIETLTTKQTNSPKWMEYRVGLITASIAYSVYTRVKTLKTKMGPHDVSRLLKTVMRENPVQTAAMARGLQLEGIARKMYISMSKHVNVKVEDSGLLIMKEHPCIGASPDGIVTCDCCNARILEIKCPLSLDRFKLREMVRDLQNPALKRTSTYFCQMQIQMGLAGVQSGHCFIFEDQDSHMLVDVPYDKEFFSDVVERLVFFFKEYVLQFITGEQI